MSVKIDGPGSGAGKGDHPYKLKKPSLKERVREFQRLREYKKRMEELRKMKEGGPGSGFFGHAGRPGQVGGSSPEGGGGADASPRDTGQKEMEKLGGKPLIPDTFQLHNNGGVWTPERQSLHEQIKNKMFEGKTPVENPVVLFTGGGTASGKSTLLKETIKDQIPENTVWIDPDEIKKSIPEYQQKLSEKDENASPYVHEEASWVSKQAIKQAGVGKYNILVDTTGDGSIDNLEGKLKALRAGGAKIIAHYATIDIETAIARAVERAKQTGRAVKESEIRLNHKGVSKTLPLAIGKGLFDELTVWDTRTKVPTKIASAVGSKLTIHHPEWWKEFLAKGED